MSSDNPEVDLKKYPGYWPGSATDAIRYWQSRAMKAERKVAELEELLRKKDMK